MSMNYRSTKGYVYILTNPSFREDWVKIGKSARPVDVRSKELDNTAVPLPFEIYATLETVKYCEVERLVHKTIDGLTKLRIRRNREFFNIKPQVALDIFHDIAQTIDDAKVVEYENNEPTLKSQPGNKGDTDTIFNFCKVGIRVGETVTFIPANIDVKVASDRKIEYEGRVYFLSGFAKKFMPDEKRTKSNSYDGPKYFTYHGQNLESMWKGHIEAVRNAGPTVDMLKKVTSTIDLGTEGRRPPFKFSMVGIEIGETITFTPTDTNVKVASDKRVEHEGQNYTLSDFARRFMPEDRRNASNAYQGPKYFTYHGQVLADIRDELQN